MRGVRPPAEGPGQTGLPRDEHVYVGRLGGRSSRASSNGGRAHGMPALRCLSRVTVVLALLLLVAPRLAGGQPVATPDTWGGDLLSRARLTGAWGGLRDDMSKKGVVFDVDLFLTPQGVLSGGRDTGAEFWGNAEYTLNVDTGKAGLWPGGFLRVIANSGFGDNVDDKAGELVPVNTAAILPKRDEPTTALMHATFMQFLHPTFGLMAGKIFTFDGGIGEFAGDYRTQFMNLGFTVPMAGALVPISAYGGGIVALPTSNVVISLLAIDPNGTTTNNDVTEAFRDGVMLLGAGKVAIKPFGLVGHQSLQFAWSDKDRVSLDQDPSNLVRLTLSQQFPRLVDPGPILRRIIERFFPGLLVPTQPLNRVSDTWAVMYGFDQYLWQPGGDSTRGVGVFFNFGASDGEANPVKYSYAVGIGGNGVVLGRPRDRFGVGWTRTDLSRHFFPFLRKQLDLGLDHEDAVEMYYNAALTPWLNATLDLQVVDPALKKTLDSSPRGLTDVPTAVVAGLRVQLRF